jgi:hypothetical protein
MIADELQSENERKVAQHLTRGEIVEAYAAKLEVAADGAGTKEQPFFDIFEKPPPGWTGSDKEWRLAVERVHDANFEQPLRELAKEELSEKDNTRFEQTVANGEMDFGFAVYYATDGSGTKDEVLKKLLYKTDGAMWSKEELDEKRRLWRESDWYDGTELDALVKDETSGRTGFDLEEALDGEPKTPEDRLARMRKRVDFENSGLLSGFTNLFTQSDECVEAQLALAEQAYAEAHDPAKTEEEKQKALAKFKERDEALQINAGEHRAAMDAITDRVTSLMKTFSMFIPGMQGLSGVAASIGTKLLLKGNHVSFEEVAQEAGTGALEQAIDMVVTVSTLGGGKVAMESAKTGLQAVWSFVKDMGKDALTNIAQDALFGFLDPEFLAGNKDVLEVLASSASKAGLGAIASVAGKGIGGLGEGLFGELAGGVIGAVGQSITGSGVTALANGTSMDGFGTVTGALGRPARRSRARRCPRRLSAPRWIGSPASSACRRTCTTTRPRAR